MQTIEEMRIEKNSILKHRGPETRLEYVKEQIYRTLDGIKYRQDTYNKAELIALLSEWKEELEDVYVDDGEPACGPSGFNCDSEHAEELKDDVISLVEGVESEVKGILNSLSDMKRKVNDL